MADQNYLDISIDCLTGTDISLLNAQNLQFPTEVTYRDYSWQIRVPDKPKGREQQKKQHAAQEAFFDIETDGPKRVV